MQKIGAIILDFDGVLAESNQAKSGAFEDLFALFPAYSDAMLAYHLENYSTSRMTKFEYYIYELMSRDGDDKMLQAMAHQFSGIVKQCVIASPDVPGALPFLREFSQKMPLYISSVTPQDELREIVQARGIDMFFTEVFGDPPCKKVDAIHEILLRENLSPSQGLFIGDSISDYRAAVETGVEFIGRDSGMPFGGVDISLYRDLHEIADVLREKMKG